METVDGNLHHQLVLHLIGNCNRPSTKYFQFQKLAAQDTLVTRASIQAFITGVYSEFLQSIQSIKKNQSKAKASKRKSQKKKKSGAWEGVEKDQ